MRRLFPLLALYGAINAIAYSSLLPMWEGFDEAYHYGYVQFLSTNLALPVLGRDTLSREIWHSYEYQPVSHYLQGFTGAPLNFTDYFAKPPEERAQLRVQLDSLAAYEKYQPQPDKPNYEVNQPPLPYLPMLAVDQILVNAPLPKRVLWIRMLVALLAVAMIAHSTLLLAGELGLPQLYRAIVLFCVFSSQMLYATICHVSNDTLAVPVMGYLIWAAIRVAHTGTQRDCLLLGLITAAALLTKAYFLFLLPLVAGAMIWAIWRKRAAIRALIYFLIPLLLLAGPWHVRNVLLYHDLSGTADKTSGVGAGALFGAAMEMPWLQSIASLAHSSLWTGNNSFTTFSSTTIDVMLLLLAASVILYTVHARRQIAEWTLAAAIGLFSIALLLISATFYVGSKHEAIAAMPWYTQLLLAPVLLLAFLGLSRARRWGRIIATMFVMLWGYVLITTYLIKLVPLYSGFANAHSALRELPGWYWNHWGQMIEMLRTVCPADPRAICTAVTAALAMCLLLAIWLGSAVLRRQEGVNPE